MRNASVFKVLRKPMKYLCSDFQLFVVLRCAAVAVIAATLLTSCATARPHLTETAALAIADREAIKHGYSLKQFEKSVKHNSPHIRNTWIVFYTRKPDSHGRYLPDGFNFNVYVTDDAKETW